jgi:hypothetical protein
MLRIGVWHPTSRHPEIMIFSIESNSFIGLVTGPYSSKIRGVGAARVRSNLPVSSINTIFKLVEPISIPQSI